MTFGRTRGEVVAAIPAVPGTCTPYSQSPSTTREPKFRYPCSSLVADPTRDHRLDPAGLPSRTAAAPAGPLEVPS